MALAKKQKAMQRDLKKVWKVNGSKHRPTDRLRRLRLKPSASSASSVRGKIRLGFLTGTSFDPIPRGTHDRDYPERLRLKNNTGANATGWGGQFMADVSVGLKIARLHPDIFHVDIMTGKEITPKRLAKNHINFNYFYDVGVAMLQGDRKHIADLTQCHKNPRCNMWPSWDYYNWILVKPRYMKQCMRAGIPVTDTIFIENGFNAKAVLKKVRAKGWSAFHVKPAAFIFFGGGAINGKTQDFIDDPSLLENYAKENRSRKSFMVQPLVTKPNGNVFDEIRNVFIDGEWAYSVYTDGTDDDAVYEQPAGALKTAAKELAIRVYGEVQKVAKWHGAPVDTLLNRIDIGVVPDASTKLGYRLFMNEIECEICTWLCRYCTTFKLVDRLGETVVKKTRELLTQSLESGQRVHNEDSVRKKLGILEQRLGPLV